MTVLSVLNDSGVSAEVLLVAGLPGCGKTTYICTMCRHGWLVFDDFKVNAHRHSSHFADSRKYRALVSALRDGVKCVVADIDFCKSEPRSEAEQILQAEVPGLQISWRFFANDPVACKSNVTLRNRPSLETDLRKIQEYSRIYSIPPGALILPVPRADM